MHEFFPGSPKSRDSLPHRAREIEGRGASGIGDDEGIRWIFRRIETPGGECFFVAYGIVPAVLPDEWAAGAGCIPPGLIRENQRYIFISLKRTGNSRQETDTLTGHSNPDVVRVGIKVPSGPGEC